MAFSKALRTWANGPHLKCGGFYNVKLSVKEALRSFVSRGNRGDREGFWREWVVSELIWLFIHRIDVTCSFFSVLYCIK